MKLKSYLYIVVCSCLLLLQLSCVNKHKSSAIGIAAASSFRPVMDKLVRAFNEQENVSCNVIYASSGKLASQISSGAPYDLFISANEFYTDKLNSENKGGPSKVVAKGKLVLVYKEQYLSCENWEQCLSGVIAIANPKTAPYGHLTQQILDQRNIKESSVLKFIYTENVQQVNSYIKSGLVDAGFTSFSSVHLFEDLPNFQFFEIDSSLNQVAVLLSNKTLAKQFYNYIFSTEAKQLIKNSGYEL